MLRPGLQAFAAVSLELAMGFVSSPPDPVPPAFLVACIEEQFYLGWLLCAALERRRLMMVCAAMIVFSLCASDVSTFQMDVAAYVLTFCGWILSPSARWWDWRCVTTSLGELPKNRPLLTALAATGLIVLMWVTGALSFGAFWMGTAGITCGACSLALSVIALQAKAGSLVSRGCSSHFPAVLWKVQLRSLYLHQRHSGWSPVESTAIALRSCWAASSSGSWP